MSQIFAKTPGFLLIEVLVAMVMFIVMVYFLSGFINVWLTTNAEQCARHTFLAQACDCLEEGGVGLALRDDGDAISSGRPKNTEEDFFQGVSSYPSTVSLRSERVRASRRGRGGNYSVISQALGPAQIWQQVPAWALQLEEHERPAASRVTVDGVALGGRKITVQVVG